MYTIKSSTANRIATLTSKGKVSHGNNLTSWSWIKIIATDLLDRLFIVFLFEKRVLSDL